jgi:hypothetical protein
LTIERAAQMKQPTNRIADRSLTRNDNACVVPTCPQPDPM